MIKKFRTNRITENETLNNLNEIAEVSKRFHEKGSKDKVLNKFSLYNKIYFGEIDGELNNETGIFKGTFYNSSGVKVGENSPFYDVDIICNNSEKGNVAIGSMFVAIRNKQDLEFYCLGIFLGSSGGSSGSLAFCKEDATNSNEIKCYPNVNVEEWLSTETYELDEWCETIDGTEYKSLQTDNTNHIVTDTNWWEEGTVSITVRCLITNGTKLMYASPFLNHGDEILIHKVGSEWISSGYNGARYMS